MAVTQTRCRDGSVQARQVYIHYSTKYDAALLSETEERHSG